jgi:hypothetical protein
MGIIAKNIIVAGETTPATIPNKITMSSEQFKVARTNTRPVAVVETADTPSKYVNKTDGELVRKINTKSDYLRDMYLTEL